MRDPRQPEGKPELENLELNKETVQDLTEHEREQAKGGVAEIITPRCTRTCECY